MKSPEVILRRPKFDLRFVTEETDYQVKYDAERPDNNFMTESILNITSKNSMEDDTAAFSFVLAGDMEWDKLLNENDLVIMNIEQNEYDPTSPFSRDRPHNNTVIIGLISEVRIEGSYDNNTKMYRVTGQSFQKAFVNFELKSIRQAGHATMGNLGWLDWTGENESEDSFMYQVHGKTVKQTAQEVVHRFGEYMKYHFVETNEENQKLDDFMRNQIIYQFDSWEDDEFLQDPLPITSFEGTLNEFVKSIAAPPFLEYFFDIRPYSKGYEKVAMNIRRTPFDKKDWENLPTYVLRTRDVINENFGRDDLEAYSIYNVVPEMENEKLAILSAVPWFNENLLEKYGYKMLEVSSSFITQGSEMDRDTDAEEEEDPDRDYYEDSTASRFGKKLYNWYANNPNFYSGEITVIGHPDYRIGNRLVYKNSKQNEIWEFYIESVEHAFTYEEGYKTILGVTRGLRVDGMDKHGVRFDPPAGEPERFEGGYLGELSIADLEEQRKANESKFDNLIGGNIDYEGEHDVTIGSGGYARPANGRVTSPYGNRLHPIKKVMKKHNGVDIGKDGGKDIYAMESGKVVTAQKHKSFGNYVEILHGTLNGKKKVVSLYAHMSRIGVTSGQSVMKGQRIGLMGETGNADGVHLHFEIKEAGVNVNPANYVDF